MMNYLIQLLTYVIIHHLYSCNGTSEIYSSWYGSTSTGNYQQFYESNIIYIYQIGVSNEQGINTDIDGINMSFRNGISEQWDDGSAGNWVPGAINAGNTPNCFIGVRVNGAASGVIHGLQFKVSNYGWTQSFGDVSNYDEYTPGDNYCMNSIEIYAGDSYLEGIRFGFDKLPSSIDYSDWFGSTSSGSYKQFYQSTTTYIYQIGVSSEQGVNIDIDGIDISFRNGIYEQWDDGSADNWNPIATNAGNTPNCFTGVRVNGAASGVIHGLQFRNSYDGWTSWYGDGSIYDEYWLGDNYCMNSVEIYGDSYLYGIRFGFTKVSGRRLLLNYAQ